MNKRTVWALLIVILLAAFFLRQYRLLDFPYHGDEVDEGDIALDILHGHLAPFYPQNEGNEALYQFVLAPFFAVLGNSVIANRFPSAAWSMVLVALMYTFGRVLFGRRRVGLMMAGLTAALWWPTVFGRLGLREISQPVMMTPALIGLVLAFRAPTRADAIKPAVVGGIFAGLTTYTFLSGRGFPIVVFLFLAYAALWHRERLRAQWTALLVYVVLMIGLSIPLVLYLAAHPELDFHVQDLGGTSWLAQGDLLRLAPQILDTLGMFTVRGDMNWVRNIPGRPVFPGIEGALFYLGVALCIWRWRKAEYALPLITLATFLGPNVIADNPPWFTRSIGILPGLMVIPVLPVELALEKLGGWVRGSQRTWVSAGSMLAVGLLGVSIYARTAADMFGIWIDNPGVYWMTLAFYDGAAKYVNTAPESTPLNYVMDVYTPWRKSNIERPVERADVALRFSLNDAFVFPENPRGWRVAFQTQGAPKRALLDAFVDLNAPIFVDARVDSAGERPLRVYSVSRARLDEHLRTAGEGRVLLPGTSSPITSPLRVAGLLEFQGYEILETSGARDELDVLTFWRVLQQPPELAVFLHLLDAREIVVSQFDGLNVVVDDLRPGDTLVQLHSLALPGNMPAGEYRFEMGAYARSDGQRLPLSVGGDSVWLDACSLDFSMCR